MLNSGSGSVGVEINDHPTLIYVNDYPPMKKKLDVLPLKNRQLDSRPPSPHPLSEKVYKFYNSGVHLQFI